MSDKKTVYEKFAELSRTATASGDWSTFYNEVKALRLTDQEYNEFSERFMTSLLANIDQL